MAQPLFPRTIGTQSRSVKFLTVKTVVRKTTVTRCLDKAVLQQGGVWPAHQHHHTYATQTAQGPLTVARAPARGFP